VPDAARSGLGQTPTNYEELRGPMPDEGVARRRGRTTGLTQLKRCPTARIDADQRTPETS
jgi:hypothetical protein